LCRAALPCVAKNCWALSGDEDGSINKSRFPGPIQVAFQNHTIVEKALERSKILSQESVEFIKLLLLN